MKISILYGSQTGTAEDLSKRISWEAKRRNLMVRVISLNDYSLLELIKETFVLLVCSTSGQGEEPDNMKSFWKLIMRKSIPFNSLSHLTFTTIGLGDSSYSKYNFVAKKLHRRFEQLGAKPLLEMALGDDQHELGPDAAVDAWLADFWLKLSRCFPEAQILLSPSEEVLLPPLYEARFISHYKETQELDYNDSLSKATIFENCRLTDNEHFQDVRRISIDISATDLHYDIGSVAIIMPRNATENVNRFIELLGLQEDQTFYLVQNDTEAFVPKFLQTPCTVRECVEQFWEIQSVPRRSFFQLLQHFARSQIEREKLGEFASTAGQEDLYDYCNRPKRSIVEVLEDFPDTTPNIPFSYLFDLIPPIRPRLFTISSSPLVYPAEIHLLVAVVTYRTRLRKPRCGLCSTFLSHLQPGDSLFVGVRKGAFRWPPDSLPAIMIGPGTGCSPFRAFCQDRDFRNLGGCYFFFGCRNKKKDFLCESDWKYWQEKGTLQLFVAFSRDQESKVYVQHKIEEEAELIWKMVNAEGAFIMIAGNAKEMPQGVQNSLSKVFQRYGGFDSQESQRYLQQLEKKGRLQFEVWA